MYKLSIVLVAVALCAVHAAPAPKASPGLLAAAPVAYAAAPVAYAAPAVVTAHSSQVVAQNFHAPLVAAAYTLPAAIHAPAAAFVL
ncbi:cuticle protein 16.5-like [Schistocerca serialis cubense]|uniref:cuticle protein 16.5-like n=1 Tax=Schistocerca serialis cubense TaxID=2023355 RepID=UPI00214DF268|nr:cuticle protein 16.5-like [Schistocerca serialis cubense]